QVGMAGDALQAQRAIRDILPVDAYHADDLAEAEGGNGKVVTAQAQGGPADEQARQRRQHPADENRRQERPLHVSQQGDERPKEEGGLPQSKGHRQQRRSIRADGGEARVPQRELPREAEDQVERHGEDRVDSAQVEDAQLVRVEVVLRPDEEADEENQARDGQDAVAREAEAPLAALLLRLYRRHAYTFSGSTSPMMPVGL